MKKIVVVGSTNIDFVVRLTEMPKKVRRFTPNHLTKFQAARVLIRPVPLESSGATAHFSAQSEMTESPSWH